MAIRKGHTSFFGLDFLDFKVVPIDSALNSASDYITYFYETCGRGI